jgi:ABC-2 type transport system permease protein
MMKSPIFVLAKKELRDFFASPIAYVFIGVFLFLSFWLYFSSVFLVGEAHLRVFFSWIPLLFVVLLPSVTMGKWAEEQKTGTLEILMTLPATDWQIIIAKLTACIGFLAVVLVLTMPLPIVFSFLGDVDFGPVWGSYFGLFLLGMSYMALGLFISSLTQNQIVAFLISVVVLFLFYIIAEPIVLSYMPKMMIPFVEFVSFNHHYESLARGVIDSRDIIYFVSAAGFFVYLNHMSLQMRKV